MAVLFVFSDASPALLRAAESFSTMKRGIFLAVGALMLSVFAGLICWRTLMPPPHLQAENFSRIERGMTLAQVEKLLGGPPGNYGQHKGGARITAEGFIPSEPATEVAWSDDSNRYEVYFNEKNIVVSTHKRAGYEQFSRPWILLRLWEIARYRMGF